ncbi:Di-copper centre-containing protein [Thozetella sp. PMI_491]|nr:Di-copper centre-containing protein [Thozetella sp. PMI_491]
MAYMDSRGPSFENPHNGVHNWASFPNGTMTDVNWSVFDPLFFLHYANIDRLVALWQAIHCNESTFNVTIHSSLSSTDKRFHTSNSVRDIEVLGYTYPELSEEGTMRPEELASAVRARVKVLYGVGAPVSKRVHHKGSRSGSSARVKYYTAEIEVERAELPLPAW